LTVARGRIFQYNRENAVRHSFGEKGCERMTQFLYCKKAEIPGDKKHPAIRAAVATAPTGGMLLSLPRSIELDTRKPTELLLYDPIQGVVRCRCRLFAPVPMGEMRAYRCEILETLSRNQRREDLKISIIIPTDVVYQDRTYPAAIHNISAGGALLVSSFAAQKGELLSFRFPKTSPPIPLTAKILRVDLRPPQVGKLSYGFGCKFVNLSTQNESLLRGYIFQEERRLYRSE